MCQHTRAHPRSDTGSFVLISSHPIDDFDRRSLHILVCEQPPVYVRHLLIAGHISHTIARQDKEVFFRRPEGVHLGSRCDLLPIPECLVLAQLVYSGERGAPVHIAFRETVFLH